MKVYLSVILIPFILQFHIISSLDFEGLVNLFESSHCTFTYIQYTDLGRSSGKHSLEGEIHTAREKFGRHILTQRITTAKIQKYRSTTGVSIHKHAHCTVHIIPKVSAAIHLSLRHNSQPEQSTFVWIL